DLFVAGNCHVEPPKLTASGRPGLRVWKAGIDRAPIPTPALTGSGSKGSSLRTSQALRPPLRFRRDCDGADCSGVVEWIKAIQPGGSAGARAFRSSNDPRKPLRLVGPAQPGIEHHADAADQQAPGGGDTDTGGVEGHKTVGGNGGEFGELGGEVVLKANGKTLLDGGEVQLEMADQPFDDLGANEVVRGQGNTPRHRQGGAVDGEVVGGDLPGVLREGIAQGADGGHA